MTSSYDPEGREAALLRSIPEFEGARVLELGIGDGRLTWHLGGRAAAVIGVEPDFEALGYLVEDHREHPGVRVLPVCADGRTLPLPSKVFDIGLLSWSL